MEFDSEIIQTINETQQELIDNEILDKEGIIEVINAAIAPRYLLLEGDFVKKTIKKLVSQKYTYKQYREAIDAGVSAYLKRDKDDELIPSSVDVFLNKLGGILFNKHQQEQDPAWAAYIQTLNKKYRNDYCKGKVINELNLLYKSGHTIQQMYKLALGTDSWKDLKQKMDDEINNAILLGTI